MSDIELAEEGISSPLFKDNKEWSDVSPIYMSEEEHGAVRIAVSDQFKDAFAYLRAVMQTGEKSLRVLQLVETCITLNPANYSVWQFRRELLKQLGSDLRKELRYITETIEENQKNYQVWHHRRCIVEILGAEFAPAELAFTSTVLEDDAKNYHAWQHRHWVVSNFVSKMNLEDELSFSLKLIMVDPRNNSAWNFRYFVLGFLNSFEDKGKMDIEFNLCKRLVEKMPNNESIWNFLAGLCEDEGIAGNAEVVAFVEDLYERTDPPKRSPYMVSFLCDILLERMEKKDDAAACCQRAKGLYTELDTLDPVRRNYWKYMSLHAENLFQKQNHNVKLP